MGQLLNEVCGGPLPGRTFKAVIPGGSSAKILKFGERFKGKRKVGAEMVDYDWGVEDMPMDFDSLAMIGIDGRIRRRDRDGRLGQHGRGARRISTRSTPTRAAASARRAARARSG